MLHIQEKLLKLLKELDDICRRRGITYYLSGGSVIGAIRNEGFLPWDDDIDVFMTRRNWELFLTVIDDELPPDRELVCIERFREYGNPVPHYVDTGTTSIYAHFATVPVPRGVCIDFFLLDPLPNDETDAMRYGDLFAVYAELVCPQFMVNRRSGLDPSPLDIGLYREYEARMRAEGRDAVLRSLEQSLFVHEEDACDRYYLRWGVKRVIYPKSVYGPPRMVPFEDMIAPVTTEVFDALRIDYGDGWRIVPDSSGQEVHDPLARDLDISYTHYVADFEPFLPRDALRAYLQRKTCTIDSLPAHELAHTGFARLEALRVRMSTRGAIAEKTGGDELGELVRSRDYATLRTIFAEYYSSQFSGPLRTWAVSVGLDDDELHAALYPLIMQGDYFKACDAFKLRLRDASPLSERLAALKRVLDAVRSLTLALDYEDYALAAEILTRSRELAPECVVFARAKLRLALAARSAEPQTIAADARSEVERHPGDGECMLYLADALALCGDADQARAWYLRAERATRDGVLLLGIRKRLEGLAESASSHEFPADDRSAAPPCDDGAAPDRTHTPTPAQARVIELLVDIDTLCRENAIRYFLSGNCALRARLHGGFTDDSVDAQVVMSPDDAQRFSAAVDRAGRSDRVVEFEPDGSGGLYYCDLGSLCLDSRTLDLTHHGLRVDIAVLKPPAILGKAARNSGTRSLVKLALRYASLVSRRGPFGLVRVHAPGAKTDSLTSARLFVDGRSAEFEGHVFPVPGTATDVSSPDMFLSDIGGANWRRGGIRGRTAAAPCVVDAHIPATEFVATARAEGLLGDDLRSALAEYRRSDAKAAVWRRHIRGYQQLVRRTADRFSLARLYAPQKADILALRASGDYDELRVRLQPYVEAAARNVSYAMGLSFDPDLLDALVDLLRHDGEAELAGRIRRLVPAQHRQSLRLPG